jgi:hypothetical protein
VARFCPECGEQITDKVKFCPECRAEIKTYTITSDDTPVPVEKIIEKKNQAKLNPAKYSSTNLLIISVSFVAGLFLLLIFAGFLSGMAGNNQASGTGTTLVDIQSNPSNPSSPVPTTKQTLQPNPSTQSVFISPESQIDRNTRIANEIVSDYHKTHIYTLNDMYVCVDMASDIWDMLKAQGINAKINVGNVDKDITDIRDADHAWVLAEISPGSYLALEATGGYSVQKTDNPRYYYGWSYDNPKELKAALDKLKHPCPAGYIFGSDQLCHEACGGSTYCTGDSVCVNGQCKGCNSGYILGDDLKCHQPCGGSTIYCTGDSVCFNGQCKSCDSGYILGTDMMCHQPCGSTTTYCTGKGICINGHCVG